MLTAVAEMVKVPATVLLKITVATPLVVVAVRVATPLVVVADVGERVPP